jgi:hypothetical protein
MKKWQSQELASFKQAEDYAQSIVEEVKILEGRVWAEGIWPLGATKVHQPCVCIEIPDDCEPIGFTETQLIFTEASS